MRHPGSTKTDTTTRPTQRRASRSERTTEWRRAPHRLPPVKETAAAAVGPSRPLAALTGGRASTAERAEVDQLTHAERVAAMQHGRLSLRKLTYWSSHHPDEVPLIGGEFAYIARYDPDYCEPSQPAGEVA